MTRFSMPSGSIAFLLLFFVFGASWAYSGPPIERFELIVLPEKSSIEINIEGDVVVEDAGVVELRDGKPVGATKLNVEVASRTKSHLSGLIPSIDTKYREIRIILSVTSPFYESPLKEKLDFWLDCNYSPCKEIDWTEYAVRTGHANLRKLSDGSRIVEETSSSKDAKQ
jgi:hypothetical protein